MTDASPAEQLRLAVKNGPDATLVAYIMCGYPRLDDTVPLMLALQRGGAGVLELGIPFSDPLADGPTIQAANTAALANGVRYGDVLESVRQARAQGLTVPVVLMGYYNPLLQWDEDKAVRDGKEAGANGFIVVDLPPEEARTFLGACKRHDMAYVPLVAPTTTQERVRVLCETASGFVYCVSVTGITGARKELPPDLADFVGRVRKEAGDERPLAVGFGISDRSQFLQVAEVAEGVVIGSAIIKAIDAADATTEARVKAAEDFAAMVTGRSSS